MFACIKIKFEEKAFIIASFFTALLAYFALVDVHLFRSKI